MRTLNPQIAHVQAIQQELEQIGDKITHSQSVAELIDLGGVVAGWMSFTGEQMATFKELWREAEKVAMVHALELKDGDGKSVKTPSLLNGYVKSVAGGAEANYEYTVRVNKTCSHVLDFLRTAISALKEEQRVFSGSNFGGR